MEKVFSDLILQTGFVHLTVGNVVMWLIAFILMYLAIKKEYEPLLLLPISFGILIVNLPLSGLMEPNSHFGLIYKFYHYGIEWEIIPPLIFLGLGALTDFGPMIANPKTLLLGGAAQIGVYLTYFTALLFGFTLKESASIAIIGGADGPTSIFLSSQLAPHMLGAVAVAAYSYMALVPIIQPPIMKLLTTKAERSIVMKNLRPVSKLEKIIFPIVTCMLVILIVPASASLMAMFMLGNLFKESGVVQRLTDVSQNALLNIVTVFLGISVGATMTAEVFLQKQVISIFILGLIAFATATASGILIAKLMNLFLKEKINPLIGAAGVSAVPMAARVAHKVAQEENKRNYLIMHAMGPNVAGVIGTLIAASVMISFLK